MSNMLANLAAGVADVENAPKLLAGTGEDKVHLLIVATADRGLCGGFNSSIVRGTRKKIAELEEAGKEIKIFCIGRKGRDQLRRDFGDLIVETVEGVGKSRLSYEEAADIALKIEQMYRRRRVRRLHHRVQPVQVGDHPDPDHEAADPGGTPEAEDESSDARRSTSSSRRRM